MAVLVRIPTPLQGLTGGKKELDLAGQTVAEIISELEQQFPGVKERLLDESGELRRFVNIYVDEEDIRFLNGLLTPVKDGSELSIIPAVAGGA